MVGVAVTMTLAMMGYSMPLSATFIHVHGLPWELDEARVASEVQAHLPGGVQILETLLPLDKRGRTTGRALLRLRVDVAAGTTEAIVAGLQHKHVVGGRWLDVRPSTGPEFEFQARARADVISRGKTAPNHSLLTTTDFLPPIHNTATSHLLTPVASLMLCMCHPPASESSSSPGLLPADSGGHCTRTRRQPRRRAALPRDTGKHLARSDRSE